MRFLGIDYGKKRIGLSISDEGGVLAFPHSVLENRKNSVKEIKKLIDKEGVEEIVIGESKDLFGNPNPIMKDINIFIENLKKETNLKINLEPEYLSSSEAEKMAPRKDLVRGERSRIDKREVKNVPIDAGSASIILQSFIDRNRS